MSSFLLIHGAGDVGWTWHLVEAELRARGHHTVAPDLPAGDSLRLEDYAEAAAAGVQERKDLVVVGHSFGAFMAPLVAALLPVRELVLVAGMIPAPGESPEDWWANTGDQPADHGSDDELYFHDVPPALVTESKRRMRDHPSSAAAAGPWPLAAWPDVRTRFILGTEDRLFPAPFLRRLAQERLGVVAEEIESGHMVQLSRPVELARRLG